MSARKTISINPDFFKSANIGKKVESEGKKKKKKIIPNKTLKPNNLKKKLLEKIKNQQKAIKMQTESKNIQSEKQQDKQKSTKENTSQETDDENFEEEFKSSLSYLQTLASQTKKNKKKSNNRPKLNLQLNPNNMQTINNNQEITQNIPATPVTLGEMPIDDNEHQMVIPRPKLPFQVTEKKELQKPENINRDGLVQQNPVQQNISLSKEPPYGCLKGGTKPVYSQYKKTLKISNPSKQTLPSLKIENNPISYTRQKFLERKSKLEQLKDKLKRKQTMKNQHSMKRQLKDDTPTNVVKKKRVKRRTYKLGRGSNTVSILIKNNATRKRIDKDKEVLSLQTMPNIKKYLREKNLIKTGSSAPDNVLRSIFESSLLTGDVTNTNNEVFLHNYMNNS